jgi:hypothetical protein
MANVISAVQITNIEDNVRIGLIVIGSEYRDRTGSGLCQNISFDIL